MSGLIEHMRRVDARNELGVDLDLEPRCESKFHCTNVDDRGISQNHGGPATYFQVTPCGHGNGLRCSPTVAAVRSRGAAWCADCAADYAASEIRFIEL